MVSIKKSIKVWMSHEDYLEKTPNNFQTIAQNNEYPSLGIEFINKKIYGIQFHPETSHCEFGDEVISNFIFNICDSIKNWSSDKMLDDITSNIKQQALNEKVVLALSGGVDSTCLAFLLRKILKNNVYFIFVDNGLLRLNEAEQVKSLFKSKFGKNFIHVNAKKEFLSKLKNVSSPEVKRKKNRKNIY